MKIPVLLLATLVHVQSGLQSANPGDVREVDVTYIANEGFLIRSGERSVLIDALFGDKEYGFCDIPEKEQIDAMVNARDVFSTVDLVAATHMHMDHFYAPFVAGHLKNNPEARFISCLQSVERLAAMEDYRQIEDQVVESTPEHLASRDTVINGIGVKVYGLKHGPYYDDDPDTGEKIDRHRNTVNLGFLFTINGVKVFHSGDSNPSCAADYEHFRLDRENIDIAFLGRGFLWSHDGPGIELINKYIKPKQIVLMHIHHDRNQRFIDVAGQMEPDFPAVRIFENLMESETYTFK